jgi:hypothetical protein
MQQLLYNCYTLEVGPRSKWTAKYILKKKKKIPQKSISDITFLFGNLATGHFSGKIFSHCTPSGPTGSNDTGLKTIALPGAESIAGQIDK